MAENHKDGVDNLVRTEIFFGGNPHQIQILIEIILHLTVSSKR